MNSELTDETQALLAEMAEGLIEPQIEHNEWTVLTNEYGDTIIQPADIAMIDSGDTDIYHVTCWGSRLSASGYLDCTDWVLGDTAQDVADELIDTYYSYEED